MFAGTREEALRQYWRHVLEAAGVCDVNGCTAPAVVAVNGAILCAQHHAYVTSEAGPALRDDIDSHIPAKSDR